MDNRTLNERFESGLKGKVVSTPKNPNYNPDYKSDNKAKKDKETAADRAETAISGTNTTKGTFLGGGVNTSVDKGVSANTKTVGKTATAISKAAQAFRGGSQSVAADVVETGAAWTPTTSEQSLGQFSGLGQLGLAVQNSKKNGTTVEKEDTVLGEKLAQRRLADQQKQYEKSSALAAKGAANIEEAKQGTGKIGSFALDVVSQTPQLAADALLNAVAPGMGTVSMFARSFGGSSRDSREKGLDDEQRFYRALYAASVETISEKMFDAFGGKIYGEGLVDKGASDWINSKTTNELKRWLLTTGKDMLGEGSEEVFSDIANWAFDSAMGLSTYDSASEAVKAIMYDFAVGGALGGVGGAITNTAKSRNAVRVNKIAEQTYGDTEKTSDLYDRAVELDVVNRASQKASDDARESASKKKNNSSEKVEAKAEKAGKKAEKTNRTLAKAIETMKKNTESGAKTDGATLRVVAEAVAEAEVEAKVTENTARAKENLMTTFQMSEAEADKMAPALGYYTTQSQLSDADVFVQSAAQYAINDNVTYYEESLLRNSKGALAILNAANGVMPASDSLGDVKSGNYESLSKSATNTMKNRAVSKGTAETRIQEGLSKAAKENLMNHLVNTKAHVYTDGVIGLEMKTADGKTLIVNQDDFVEAMKQLGFSDSKKELGKIFDAITNSVEQIKEDTSYGVQTDTRQLRSGTGRDSGEKGTDGERVAGREGLRGRGTGLSDDGTQRSADERAGGQAGPVLGVGEEETRGKGTVPRDNTGDVGLDRRGLSDGQSVESTGRGSRSGRGRGRRLVSQTQELYKEHPELFSKRELRSDASVYIITDEGIKNLPTELQDEIKKVKDKNAKISHGRLAPEVIFIKDLYPLKGGESEGARVILKDGRLQIFVSLSGSQTPTEIYNHEVCHAIFTVGPNFQNRMTRWAKNNTPFFLRKAFKDAYADYEALFGEYSAENKYRFMEELVCDLYAGVNRNGWIKNDRLFNSLSKTVQEKVGKWLERNNPSLKTDKKAKTGKETKAIPEELKPDLQKIIDRLELGDHVSLQTILNNPGVKMALQQANSIPATDKISTPERNLLRKNIEDHLINLGSYTGKKNGEEVFGGKVDSNKHVDIVMGLPAAGKSSVLVNPLSEKNKALIVDCDMVKQMLPEFNEGIGAGAVHEESKNILDNILDSAREKGYNIVYPIVGGGDFSKIEKTISDFRDSGYTVSVHLNEVPRNTSMARALSRFLSEGRFLNPQLIYDYGNKPVKNFEKVIRMGLADDSSRFSNDVAYGVDPVRLDADTGLSEIPMLNSEAGLSEDEQWNKFGSLYSDYMSALNKYGEFDDRVAKAKEKLAAFQLSFAKTPAMFMQFGFEDGEFGIGVGHTVVETENKYGTTGGHLSDFGSFAELENFLRNGLKGKNLIAATMAGDGTSYVRSGAKRDAFAGKWAVNFFFMDPSSTDQRPVLFRLKPGALVWEKINPVNNDDALSSFANYCTGVYKVSNFPGLAKDALKNDTLLYFDEKKLNGFGFDRVAKMLSAKKNSGKILHKIPTFDADTSLRDVSRVKTIDEELAMLPTDSNPREYSSTNQPLSEGQVDYFDDSKLRDDLGRLMTMFVGNKHFGFEFFDPAAMVDKRSLFMTDSPLVAASYSGWPRSVLRLREMIHAIDKNTDMNAVYKEYGDDLYGEWETDSDGVFHDSLMASAEDDDSGARIRRDAAMNYLLEKGFSIKETDLDSDAAAEELEGILDAWYDKALSLTKNIIEGDESLEDALEDYGLTDALEKFEDAFTTEEKSEALRAIAKSFNSLANDVDSFDEGSIELPEKLAKRVYKYAAMLSSAADQFYYGLFDGNNLSDNPRTFMRALPVDEQAEIRGAKVEGDKKFYHVKSPDPLFGTRLMSEDEMIYQATKLEGMLQNTTFAAGNSKGKEYRPGIYQVYGNITNPLIVNKGGDPIQWNSMPLEMVPEEYREMAKEIMATWGHTMMNTRHFSELAERNGYDGVIFYNLQDVGGAKSHGIHNNIPSTVAIAFNPNQIKSTANLEPTLDKRLAYMLPEGIKLDKSYARSIVELGRALQRQMDESVNLNMTPANIGSIADSSDGVMGRVILHRKFDNLGSAKAGFDPYSAAQLQYGSMESRPSAYRYANAPKSIDGNKKVTQSVVTVASSKATPETRLKEIEDAVMSGKLSHEVKTDATAMRNAKEALSKDGWEVSYGKWSEQVKSGKHDKATVAMGALLLDVAGNSDRADGNTYIDILQDYADVLTRAGQILQAGKLIQQLTPMGKLYGIEKSVDRINEEIIERAKKAGVDPDTIEIDKTLLVKFRDAETEEDRAKAMDEIYQNIADKMQSTSLDKFTAWRYTAMLGNFRTQIRNVLGNAGFQPIRALKETTNGLMEALVSSVSGGKLERTTSAFHDRATFKKAHEIFQQDADIIMRGGKYSDNQSSGDRSEIDKRRRIFKNKALEAWRKGTNWAMDKGDLVFCSFTYADSLSRFMRANNTTWDEASPELQERARLKAIKDAAEATYRDSNDFADAFARVLRQNNTEGNPIKKALNLIGEGILPFRKTPANILLRAVEYSPLNIIDTAVKVAQYNLAKADVNENAGKVGQMMNKAVNASKEADVTGADIISSLAKTITGSALVLLGFSLASMGHLKGKAPEDDKEKEFWELMGHQEYSVEINGKSYTLDWLAPESIPLYLGANLYQAALSSGLTLKEALEAVSSISDPMLQMSMLQGVNDALENASTYGDESALPRFVENAMWSYLTQFIPTLAGQANRSLTNTRMSTYVDKNKDVPDFWQKLAGKLTGKVPGLNKLTGAQIEYIDSWGRTEKNADTATLNVLYQLFSPGYASTIEETAMEKELQRLYDATGSSSVLISRADKYFNVNGNRVDLTSDQYLTYSQTRGQTAFKLMTSLTSSSSYRSMTNEQKVKAVQNVYTYANEIAKERTIRSYEITESWVLKAREATNDYNIPVSDYVNLYSSGITSVESIKDAKGEPINNTASMRKAKIIYDMYPNLTSEQYAKLFDDFNVGTTIRKWAPALINKKLAALGD